MSSSESGFQGLLLSKGAIYLGLPTLGMVAKTLFLAAPTHTPARKAILWMGRAGLWSKFDLQVWMAKKHIRQMKKKRKARGPNICSVHSTLPSDVDTDGSPRLAADLAGAPGLQPWPAALREAHQALGVRLAEGAPARADLAAIEYPASGPPRGGRHAGSPNPQKGIGPK